MSVGMAAFCAFIIIMALLVFVLPLFFALKKTIIEAIKIKKEEALIKKCNEIQEIPTDIAMFFNHNGFAVYFIRFLKIHNLYREYIKRFTRFNDSNSKKRILIHAELNPNDLCRYISFIGDYNKWVVHDEIWRNIWVRYYEGMNIKYKDFYFRYIDKETFEKEKKLAKMVFYEHFLRRKKVE